MTPLKNTVQKSKVNLNELKNILDSLDKHTIKRIINIFLRDKSEFIFIDLRLAKEKLVKKIVDYLSVNTSYVDKIYDFINSRTYVDDNDVIGYRRHFENVLMQIKEIMVLHGYGKVYEIYRDSVFKLVALSIITEGEVNINNTFICNDVGLVHPLDDIKINLNANIVLYDIEKNDEGNYNFAISRIKKEKRKIVFISIDVTDPDMLKILSHFEPYVFLDLKFVDESDVKQIIKNKLKSSVFINQAISKKEGDILINIVLSELFYKTSNETVDRQCLRFIDNIINEILIYKLENPVDELSFDEIKCIVNRYI